MKGNKMGNFTERVETVRQNIELYGDEENYCLAEDPNAYTEAELHFHRILWELNCAMILKDWNRVANAVVLMAGKPKGRPGRPKKGGYPDGQA